METGVLQRQRIKQVMTVLACYFDSATLYQKEHAELLLPLMRILAENNDGTLFKAITGQGETQFLKMSPSNFCDEYEVTVQEAPDSATEKEERSDLFMKMATELFGVQQIQPAMAILALAVKSMPLKYSEQQEIIQILQPQQGQIDPAQVQKLVQTVQQLSGADHKAQLAETISKAHLNTMKANAIVPEMRLKRADTGLRQAQADQTNVETHILRTTPPDRHTDVDVNA